MRSLILSLPTATALSLFIYLHHYDLAHPLLLGLLAVVGIFFWLRTPRSRGFWLGFWVAVFWFWWVGMSFRFTDYGWLSPLVVLGGASMYGVIFYLIAWLPLWARAVVIAVGFEWIEPLSFVWFKPDLLLLGSHFSEAKGAFVVLVFALAFLARPHLMRPHLGTALGAVLLAVAFFWPAVGEPPPLPDLAIKLVQSDLGQDLKWQRELRDHHAAEALAQIDEAIKEGYDLVVLPEAAFPLFLNASSHLMGEIQKRSQTIAIFTGGLHYKEGFAYNSAYLFDRGEVTIADKVYLVPFGEGNPLPNWLSGWVNNIFFEGAEDYQTAEGPTDFRVGGALFRAAICYEATVAGLFKDAPPYMIAISNNGWFVPSIEPTLQRLLMQLQARRNGVMIFHASNQSPSEIIF